MRILCAGLLLLLSACTNPFAPRVRCEEAVVYHGTIASADTTDTLRVTLTSQWCE